VLTVHGRKIRLSPYLGLMETPLKKVALASVLVWIVPHYSV